MDQEWVREKVKNRVSFDEFTNHMIELQTKTEVSVAKASEMFKVFNFLSKQQDKIQAQYDTKWV